VFSSLTVSVLLTAMFVATGGWALYRLAVRVSGRGSDVDLATELAHLLMSLAMLAMVWEWSGGPGSASGIFQLVLFGGCSLWFFTETLLGSLPSGLHMVSTTAMVWMVVAMPQLMSRTNPAITVVTVLFTILLAAAAGAWILHAVIKSTRAQIPPDEPENSLPGTVRTAVRPADQVAVRVRVAARLGAACHAIMNLGMAAVLVGML
jgi:Domain of unknown function (DUF5134)